MRGIKTPQRDRFEAEVGKVLGGLHVVAMSSYEDALAGACAASGLSGDTSAVVSTFGPNELVSAARRFTKDIRFFDSGGFGIPDPRAAFRYCDKGTRSILVNGEEGFEEDVFSEIAKRCGGESIAACGPSFGFGVPSGRFTCYDLSGDSVLDCGGGLVVSPVEFAAQIRCAGTPMSESMAGAGLTFLSEFYELQNDRDTQIRTYRKHLKGVEGIDLFPVNFARMTVKVLKRAKLIAELEREGYESAINHECLHVRNGESRRTRPFGEVESTWMLSLPVGDDVSLDEIERVCEIVREVHA